MADFALEDELYRRNFRLVCGIDEVGRGALFGPVVSGAVILDPDRLNPEIDDSKSLSPKKRLELADWIYNHARAYAVGWAWNDEIDRVNITEATKRSMRMALDHLQLAPDFVLLDGFQPDFLPVPGLGIIQGDRKSLSIAAASIIAKVLRDQLLVWFAFYYPEFDLAKNKGYPTHGHRNVVLLKGRTIFHRNSFRINDGCRKSTENPENR